MSMTKWVHDPQFIPGTLVRAESINDRFNGISSSIESIVDTYEGFSIRLPANFEGQTLIPEQTLTNKIFYLDENGDVTLYSLDTFDTAVQLSVDKAAAAADSASYAEQMKDETVGYRDKAQEWANASYGAEVETGLYSGKHWAEQAKKWSETSADEEVEPGLYSARHWADQSEGWADKAKQWSDASVGVEVEPGRFSARHWQQKAREQADRAEYFADALDVDAVAARLDEIELLALAGL